MKPYTIEFIAQDSITTMLPLCDAFKFKPKIRWCWLQLLAWRFLHWSGGLIQAYEPIIKTTRHTIDADKLIERIIKQRRALFDGYNKHGQRLIIGAEDYAELMECPEIRHHFVFNAEVGKYNHIMGLKVEIVPWMRGAVVMP